MLKCRDVVMQGSRYLDKRLPCGQSWSVSLHLLMCKHCRCFIRQLATTTKVVSLQRFPITSTTETEEIVHVIISRASTRMAR